MPTQYDDPIYNPSPGKQTAQQPPTASVSAATNGTTTASVSAAATPPASASAAATPPATTASVSAAADSAAANQPQSPGGSTARAEQQPQQPASAPLQPTAAAQVRQPTVGGGSAVDTPAIATSIPDRFKGSTNAEAIEFLQRFADRRKPMSDADLDKLRKRQRTKGIIAAISDAASAVTNMIGVHNYSPNAYNPSTSLSARLRERFEKEKAERDANDEKYFNALMQIAKLKGDDRDRELNIFLQENKLKADERAYNDSRTDRATEVKFRQDQFDEGRRQWQDTFDTNNDHWQQQFDEGKRQFDVNAANDRARIGLEAQRVRMAQQEGQITWTTGKGNITLTKDKFNEHNISYIYNGLPSSIRAQYAVPVYEDGGNMLGKVKVEGKTTDPDITTMMVAIGANIGNSPETQDRATAVATGEYSRTFVPVNSNSSNSQKSESGKKNAGIKK